MAQIRNAAVVTTHNCSYSYSCPSQSVVNQHDRMTPNWWTCSASLTMDRCLLRRLATRSVVVKWCHLVDRWVNYTEHWGRCSCFLPYRNQQADSGATCCRNSAAIIAISRCQIYHVVQIYSVCVQYWIFGIREEYGCIVFNMDLFQMENICLYSSDKYIKSNDKYFVSGQSTNTFEARQISGENLVFIWCKYNL